MNTSSAALDSGHPLSRGPGVLGSLLLHVAALAFLLYRVGVVEVPLPLVPVEVVPLAEETTTPAPAPDVQPQARPANRQVASVAPPRTQTTITQPAPPPAPVLSVPSTPQPAPDAAPPRVIDRLETQLEALARLRLPNATGTGSAIASGTGAPGSQAYSVKDLIRAQVQRRWSLNLEELGDRNLVVSIHVVLERDGTVTTAEIVDASREKDATFYSISVSARNAIILASPLSLPAGIKDDERDFTLSLNTRDMLR